MARERVLEEVQVDVPARTLTTEHWNIVDVPGLLAQLGVEQG